MDPQRRESYRIPYLFSQSGLMERVGMVISKENNKILEHASTSFYKKKGTPSNSMSENHREILVVASGSVYQRDSKYLSRSTLQGVMYKAHNKPRLFRTKRAYSKMEPSINSLKVKTVHKCQPSEDEAQ